MLDTTVACGGKKVFSKTAARLHRVGANEWQFALTAVIFTAHTFALHLFSIAEKRSLCSGPIFLSVRIYA